MSKTSPEFMHKIHAKNIIQNANDFLNGHITFDEMVTYIKRNF